MSTKRKRRKKRTNFRLLVVLLALLALLGGVLWAWLSGEKLPGEGVEVPDYVTQDFLTVNEWSRPGTELTEINAVVIHYVGNPATSAQANRNYFETLASGELDTYASSHFVVGLEGEVVQCVPLTEISHASNTRNSDTIAVEVCHPDETGQFAPVTYQRVVELTAWLCREFELSPETGVIRHYDVTGKLCPLYYVENPDAWMAFLADVQAEMERQTAAEG